MKKVLFAAVFALFASTQAFAIIGVGAHYIMNTGSLKGGAKESIYDIEFEALNVSKSISVEQKKADGLQGLGFKLWIDFLPMVDIEGTFNISATRYNTYLYIPTPSIEDLDKETEIDLGYTPEAPYNMLFDHASPLYGLASGDLSITYPVTSLPFIRPYVGAGISYFASIPIVNADFTKKMLESSPELIDALTPNINDPENPSDATDAAKQIGAALSKALKNADYKTGIGGHIVAGTRFKAPIFPVAIYTNGKYYFGGNTSSQFSQGFVLEVGGGLAL